MERIQQCANADEENIPHAIGLPIEELIEPHPTIYYVNATLYQSQSQTQFQTQLQTQLQNQYIPQHPNNRQHQHLRQSIQERERLEPLIKRSVCQRIVISSIMLFGLIAASIYFLQ